MYFNSEHDLQTMGVFHISLLNLQEDTIPQAVAQCGVFPPADSCHVFPIVVFVRPGTVFCLVWGGGV
jgi:hypothetical protein